MIKINLLLTYKKDLPYINEFHGLIIHCIDSRETYYINKDLNKIEITLNTVVLEKESDLNNIISPILSRIYIIKESKNIYKYTNRWTLVETEESLLEIVEASIDYMPSVLYKSEDFLAPKTLASAVYLDDGTRLSSALDSKHLTVTKTRAIYVEAEINRQRIFNIPYPITNFDLCRNHISVIVRGLLLEPNKYVINNNRLILNSNVEPLNQGELMLFIFYYTTVLDLNENVVLTTKNYEDKSITTEKLSENIAIKATNILETPRRYFMTPEQIEKLDGLDYGATRYVHPPTHPAEMIVESEERMFISRQDKEKIDLKAYSRDVYTREETTALLQELFESIVGSTPETLDTLKELADALGNDPNFATTILEKLSEKADKTEISNINEVLETKVNINDYLRTGIYTTPIKTSIYDIDNYRISVKDEKFKEYIDGMPVIIKITESNKGPATLQINALEAKPILTQDQYPLIKGELKVGSIYTLRYNGGTGNFILQGKGGVNVEEAARSEYIADLNETIIRGNLLDLINGKVRVSVPRCTLLSDYVSANVNFNCDGKIKTIPLGNDKFFVAWKDGIILKGYLFTISQLDMFINGNTHGQDPMMINLECNDFDMVKINDEKIVVSYLSKDKYIVNSLVLNIIDNELVPGNMQEFEELDHIFNLKNINVKNDRFLIAYQFGDKTKVMYSRVVDNDIEIMSSRTNAEYTIESHCFINDEQILFAGSNGTGIKGWVMNIRDLDINYTTISDIVVKQPGDTSYKNLSFTLYGENKVYFTFTNQDETKQYKQHLEIDFNGDILANNVLPLYSTPEEIANNLISNRIRVHNNFLLSVSNLDMTRPLVHENNDKYMKIKLQVIDDTGERDINKYTIIPNIYTNLSYTMIDKTRLLIVYSSRNNENESYRLFFNIVEVKRKPDMIAMSNGNEGEAIAVVEW